MPFLICYLLKLSISLSVVWCVYWFLLRHLTFYTWNRYFLLIYSLFAFVIPFIDIAALLQQHDMRDMAMMNSIPSLFVESEMQVVATERVDYWMAGLYVFAAGMIGMFIRLLFQYTSLCRIRKSATLLHAGGLKLYHVNEQIMPFSFGDSIFVNQHLHQEEELREIIRHEFIHVKQKHSVDIVFGELLCMLNWYNPFAWLIRNAIRQNLEFIADSAVLSNGMDKKAYQYLLLKVTGVTQFSIANNFNFSSLKKRIAMMNKQKSAKVNLIRFLLMLPVISIVVLAFRGEGDVADRNGSVRFTYVTDTVPPPPPPDPPDAPSIPDGVRSINVNNGKARVILDNGKVENYDLNTAAGKADFEARYGKMIAAPAVPARGVKAPIPPTPPKPPAPPKPASSVQQANESTLIVDAIGEAMVVQGYRASKTEAVVAGQAANVSEPIVVQSYRASAREAVTSVRSSSSREAIVSTEPVVVQGYRKSPAEVTVAGRPSVRRMQGSTAVSELAADEIIMQPDANVIGTDYDLQLIATFTFNSTQEDIDKVSSDLQEQGYKLTIELADFRNGKLVRLAATISKGKDKSSFNASEFNRLVISIQKKNGKSGFHVHIYNGKISV